MMKGQPHLMTQDAKTVDPSKLTALTPEVVSLSRRRSVVGRIVPWVPRSYARPHHTSLLSFLLVHARFAFDIIAYRSDLMEGNVATTIHPLSSLSVFNNSPPLSPSPRLLIYLSSTTDPFATPNKKTNNGTTITVTTMRRRSAARRRLTSGP